MLYYITDDIVRIKEAAQFESPIQEKKDFFLTLIYTFLYAEYPEAINEEMKAEAAKYVKK